MKHLSKRRALMDRCCARIQRSCTGLVPLRQIWRDLTHFPVPIQLQFPPPPETVTLLSRCIQTTYK